MLKHRLKSIVLSATTLVAIGTITVTTASCSQIDKTILDNQVKVGDNTLFATGYTLEDQIKAALKNTSNTAFSKTVVNQLLYNWYTNYAFGLNGKNRQVAFADNWSRWYDELSDTYEDKVSQYKTDYKNNWQWFFQTSVLEPLQAYGGQWAIDKKGKIINNCSQKDHYIKLNMYDKIRTDFQTRVFGTNYFGLPAKSGTDPVTAVDLTYDNNIDAAAFNNLTYNPQIKAITASDSLVKKVIGHPGTWQFLDFYADVNPSYIEKELNYQFAYLQHLTFEEYFKYNHPVSTAMSLWKNTENDKIVGGWEKIYNKSLVPTENQKTSWEFPWYEDSSISGPPVGPNSQFKDFVRDGFNNNTTGASASFFKPTYDLKDTGLMEIPTNSASTKYTDDSATIFKVNLSSDGFTSTFLPFASAVSELWTTQNSSFVTSLPVINRSYSGNNTKYFWAADTEYPLFESFLYKGVNSALPFESANTKLAKLGNSPTATVAVRTSLGQEIETGNHAVIFNKDSKWYQEGYMYVSSGYQLSTGSTRLPYVLVKERGSEDGSGSGVHFIGLDAYKFLSWANANPGFEGIAVDSSAYSYDREMDVIKLRSYQDLNQNNNPVGSGFNVTSSLSDFFGSNYDRLILEVVNKTVNNDSYLKDNKIFDIADNSDAQPWTNWEQIYKLAESINNLNAFTNLQSNIDASNEKAFSFNLASTENMIWRAAGWNSTSSTYYVKDTGVYKNGVGYNLPFDFYVDNTWYTNNLTNKKVLKALATLDDSIPVALVDFTFDKLSATLDTAIDAWYESANIKADWDTRGKIGLNQFSERVSTNNDVANSLLTSFGDSEAFTSAVIGDYYKRYVESDGTAFIGSDSLFNNQLALSGAPDGFGDWIEEMYNKKSYTPSVLTEGKIQQFLNSGNTSTPMSSINEYLSTGSAIWKRMNASKIQSSGSADRTLYYKSLASLKYLISKDGKFDPSKFISWLRRKINFGDQASFLWTAKDYIDYPATNGYFSKYNKGTVGANINDIYTWKTNYNDLLDNAFLNSNADATASYNGDTTTHTKYSSYYSIGKFGSTNYTGYAGLKVNSASDTDFSNYFSNFLQSNPYTLKTTSSNQGALYHYNQLTTVSSGAYNWINVNNVNLSSNVQLRYSLFGLIASYANDLPALKALSAKLVTLIPDFTSINDKIQSDINLYQSGNSFNSKNQAQGLINALYPSELQANILDSNWNKNSDGAEASNPNNYGATSATLTSLFRTANDTNADGVVDGLVELVNPAPIVGKESLFKKDNEYSRYAFAQLNYIDLLPNNYDDQVTTTSAIDVFNKLTGKYGYDVIMQLLYESMNDGTNSSYVEADVIKYVKANGGLIEVYDRRFNDKLTKKWISNYKSKN